MKLAIFALLGALNPPSLIAHLESSIVHPAPVPDSRSGILDAGLVIPDERSGIRDSDEVIDRLMAVVSGRTITLSDVTAAGLFHLVQVPPGTTDAAGYTVERLVERTLILAEVDRFQPPEPDPIEITIRVDALEREAGSAAAFDKRLAVTGMTREQLRRHIRDELRITTYLNQRFGGPETAERQASVTAWIEELRKRADVTVLRK